VTRLIEKEEFGDLFELHASAVFDYLLRRTADRSLADDLTSVVFLEAWRIRSRMRLSPESGALPWLLAIAGNVLRQSGRSRRRYAAALERLRESTPVDPIPRDLLEVRERLRLLKASLDALPRSERETLALCVLADLSYADAALALGVSVETVRSRLARARRRLRAEHPDLALTTPEALDP
jgi:RNA polymerase sigma factor (sigma-70 family)